MSEPEQKVNQKNKQDTKGVDWIKIVGMIVTLIIIIIVSLVTMQKYKIIGESLKSGNYVSSVLLLSPEISTGIADIVKAFH
jgi:hypothetical protein